MSMEILFVIPQGKDLQIVHDSASLLELDLNIAKSIRHVLIYWAVLRYLSEQYTSPNKNSFGDYMVVKRLSCSEFVFVLIVTKQDTFTDFSPISILDIV